MQEISILIAAARAVLGTFDLTVCIAGNVGAALETEAGTIYTGICLDLACGVGFCAEHSAVAEMLKHRETAIRQIVAVGDTGIMPPCGRCRELLMQIDRRNAECRVILSETEAIPLKELLPRWWLEQPTNPG